MAKTCYQCSKPTEWLSSDSRCPQCHGQRLLGFLSFDEWKAHGRVVSRGEKSYRRDFTGKAVFHFDQTEELDDDYCESVVDGYSGHADDFDFYPCEDGLDPPITAYDLGYDWA